MNGADRHALLQIARNHMIAHLGGVAAAEPSLVGELPCEDADFLFGQLDVGEPRDGFNVSSCEGNGHGKC